MIETTYICDRCKKPQLPRIETSQPPLWRITIRCEPIDSFNKYCPSQQDAQWCNTCVEELKVKRPLIYAGGVTSEPPTLEAVIRDIVRSEMEE